MCGVSVVNGYMCYSPCQAAAARDGKDPHAPPGQSERKDKANGLTGRPPAILDPGYLASSVNAIDPTAASGAANSDYRSSQIVDLVV